ncbi:MAG: extracellular solute-binding protein [Roseitalea porphyridii]|jgi:multiple sugar transport system substrate-binding protein|uniref:ABC transporter substrate-binding protein n=1 Tax=Roseitalea porphyridii TaxID=1852022 RepID=UPI0032EEDBCB
MKLTGSSHKGGASRRRVLQGMGAAGVAAAAGTFGLTSRAHAQQVTLRWWSPQSAPAQLAAYRAQIAAFEAANPDIKVMFEPTSDEGYATQLAAAFASGEVPHIVTHLPSFAVQTYYAEGLIEPFNDVIEAIGPDKYYEGANEVYKAADGNFVGTGIGNTAADMLWVRRDLMEEAGVDKIPVTWDELRSACQKMQGGGVFGAPLPYGLNSMTSLIFIGFIHRAGGSVFSPDLEVALDSQATYDALEFYASMRELSPPGATGYSWGESLTAFVSGATATGIYAGRVLANVTAQNPAIAGQVTNATYPRMSEDIPAWTFNDFPSVFIPAQADNKDAAKRFAAFLFEPPGYIEQLHAAPGHVLPVLRTISEDPAYQDNEIIEQFTEEVDLMAAAAAAGHNLGYETPQHQSNAKAGEIIASNAIAEMVQRVVLNDEDPKAVVGATAQRLEEIMNA